MDQFSALKSKTSKSGRSAARDRLTGRLCVVGGELSVLLCLLLALSHRPGLRL